jgi:hypothetical protein
MSSFFFNDFFFFFFTSLYVLCFYVLYVYAMNGYFVVVINLYSQRINRQPLRWTELA